VGLGREALPRKLPWREVVELRRVTMEFAMDYGVATAPTSPPWGSGEEGREGAEVAGLDLDLGEECLHCPELALLSALPCRRPPPPFFLLSHSQAGSTATRPAIMWLVFGLRRRIQWAKMLLVCLCCAGGLRLFTVPVGRNAACLLVLVLNSPVYLLFSYFIIILYFFGFKLGEKFLVFIDILVNMHVRHTRA
jgi:hypothetical protein